MVVTLKNKYLTVKIKELGAEITSVKDNASHIEYIWDGDKHYWKRHAPILFPIVGRLRDDDYIFDGTEYHMFQHGFARDSEFEVESHNQTEVNFMLHENEKTLKAYPFKFNLSVHYELKDHTVLVEMAVENPNEREMYFSLGAHPGFNVPLLPKQETFGDYSALVAPREKYQLMQIDSNGLSENDSIDHELPNPLPLNHELFAHDAKIIDVSKNKQTTVMLQSEKSDHGVALTTYRCKYIGLWSPYPKEAPFVCIEPWWGIADKEGGTGFLKDKKDISRLEPTDTLNADFDITFF